MRVPGFEGLHPIDVAKQSVREHIQNDMNTYAGALTFRMLLAIVPFLISLLTVLGALGLERFFNWAVREVQAAFPSDIAQQFQTIIEQVRGGASGGLLSFGLLAAIWAAAGGIRSAINALNAAYDVEESRPFWKVYPMSILFTIGLGLVLVTASVLMLLGPQAMQWLADQVGLGDVFVTIWGWIRFPVAVVLMTVAVALVYYFLPNVDQPFRLVTPGSVFAVLSWVLATIGFSFYLSRFSTYNATYGSLAGVVILLLYFFISSIMLLLGAEINATIYKKRHDLGKINVVDERGDRG